MDIDRVNGSRSCADGCVACAAEERLRLLAGKLGNKGLEATLMTCGTAEGHYDSVNVVNPAAPQRGTFHIDDDGIAAWDFPGATLDDDGVGRMVDEAITVLRANGVRLPKRQSKEP